MKDVAIYQKILYLFDNTIRHINIENYISIFSIYRVITMSVHEDSNSVFVTGKEYHFF